MTKILTTCELITTTYRRGMIPDDQGTFSPCDVIAIMNEELNIHIVPSILKVHEEYFVENELISLVCGVCTYKIPDRAIGNKLRDVAYVAACGTQYEMTRKSLEDRAQYGSFIGSYSGSHLIPFYLGKDEVVLFQCQSNTTGFLLMTFYLQPNTLVKSNRGAKITAIATCTPCATTTFTLDQFPCHYSATSKFDFISGNAPSSITTYSNCVCTFDSNVKTLTFVTASLTRVNPNTQKSTTLVVTPVVGDYIMAEKETVVPQLPAELHPLLAQRTAIKIHEAQGDFKAMERAQQELDRMEQYAYTIIDNRVEGAPQKINNTKSTLRSAINRRWWT